MQALKIDGGARLEGVVNVKGSKNTALAVMSAVLLAKGRTTLSNMPDVADTRIKAKVLRQFGASVDQEGDRLSIDFTHVEPGEIDEEDFRSIRTGFYLLGPLLARIGKVVIPAPGGCKIGARPVDFHIRGLELLGARVELRGGYYHAETDGLKGAEIFLNFPSAGATQHLMATACLATGHTVIENAAIEPEVMALANFLNRMGGRVEGAGTSKITIAGVQELQATQYRIPADRLQAGTYLLGAAITQGDVTAAGILPDHQTAMINKLREAGARAEEGPDWVRVTCDRQLDAIRVMTMPYPGFPTDMQQPMAALLATAQGTSVIEETIYESRIGHVQELNRMGAQIRIEGRATILTGVSRLNGAVVEASDLRAGAALCLAGLAAEGVTVVRNVHFIDRGYENLEQTLSSLGASVHRIEETLKPGMGSGAVSPS